MAAPDDSGSRRISWRGRGDGQLYLSSEAPADLSDLLAADAAMLMVLMVEAAPSKQTTLRMGCGYPCAGITDVTRLLRALPTGEWVKLSMDLQCFVQQGLDVTRVDTPFHLLTGGKLDLRLGEVRLVPGLADEATIRCD